MYRPPEFLKAVQKELADWRMWSDRLVVLLFAGLAGLTVVVFTWLSEHALATFFVAYQKWFWWPLLWTPLLTMAIVFVTRRFAAGTAGSGIPQVMAALSVETPPLCRSLYVSLKLSLMKVALTASGLLAGLSLGREGPSVQIAAGVMHSARRWLSPNSPIKDSGLILAGGAAGIAAAFNTPLGGVMFAIEELSRRPEDRRSGLLMAAIILAGLMAVSAYGNKSHFGEIRVDQISFALLLPGMVVAVLSGIFGGMFARLLIYSLHNTSSHWVHAFRRSSPIWFAGGCGLLIAIIGLSTQGATFGSGYAHTRAMLENTDDVSSLYVLLKLVVTWLTTWAGVPAGIFAPALAIGAALGNDLAMLMQYPNAPTLIALGMAGFLAAVTQAPLTAFIIVMEMVTGHELVLSLMASALIASGISRLISQPLYAALTHSQLGRLPGKAPGQV
ncbi:chloride channel protein [Limnohabitans sp. Bal53]|uniref:chloride channel protein n=1 Tax=Limnohabitans sp. Bal53 TaxID=1977910 RepID=UPI000D389358|nr:chloride channel protein [Limnohabitans sp. Bal53]PUE39022.1 chloride channel protein [Limnohabitans sp. Bal53]